MNAESDREATPRRQPLSRERVIAAAMALADDGGLDAVTIRGLARALHVEPMSLYHYAASRDEIVGWLVDQVVDEIDLPPSGGDWKSAIRATAISAHAVLRRHPWACNLLMAGPRIAQGRLRQIDALLEHLDDAHLPPELADLAYHAIDSHILGFTLWEAGYARGLVGVRAPADLEAFLKTIQIERYPHLQAHALWHGQPREAGRPSKNEFEFGLDLILDGVERLREAEATA